MSKGWDNTALKKLKALMGKGLSTSEIGKRLGMSKNAVVGKLNRLGWNLKAGGVAGAEAKKKAETKSSGKATASKGLAQAKGQAKKTTASSKSAAKVKIVAEKKPVVKEEKKAVTSKQAPKTSGKATNKSLAMHQRIIQHSLEMANLKPNQCRWPIGDPDSENFHFCGAQVFVGKPYCYEHCKQAYQFTPPKKK